MGWSTVNATGRNTTLFSAAWPMRTRSGAATHVAPRTNRVELAVRVAATPELIKRLDFWRDVELTRAVFFGTTKITAPAAAPVKKIMLPDDDRSPLDELPPWDGSGEDILADTEMEDEAVDTDDIDDIDEEGDEIDE